MLIIHFIGMPGSGKTTVAIAFMSYLCSLRSTAWFPVTYIEMSDVVKQWMQQRPDETGNDLLDTPLESANLYNLLYSKIQAGINVVSGVREFYLLDPTSSGIKTATVKKVGLESSVPARLHRYIQDGESRKDFTDAEARSLQMGVPGLMDCCDVVIDYDEFVMNSQSFEDLVCGIFVCLLFPHFNIVPIWAGGK